VIEVTTRLPAPASEVWGRAVTPEGINDELRPILRMTMPRGMEVATIEDVPTGETLGRSWILLGGLLPVDYDDLRLTEIEPGRRFQERSRTASFAVWSHERIVEPAGEGECTVTDRLGWEFKPLLARVPGAGRLATAIVGFLFRHRHRRLERYWSPAARRASSS
jgi:hypothetical protein